MTNIEILRSLGFDRSKHSGRGTYRVACSQCAAVVINSIPTHERGCPNATHECHGCNARIPLNQRYCENCK